jgi:hypothetical protein
MVADVSSPEPALPGDRGLTGDALLAGPRGRSLCVDVLDDRLTELGDQALRAWANAISDLVHGRTKRGAAKLSECVHLAGLSGHPFTAAALMTGLRAAADFACYWEEPDREDRAFAGEAVRAALRPVADAVVAAVTGLPDARWWAEPADLRRQRYTQFLDQDPRPEPLLTGAGDAVTAWLAGTRQGEQPAHDWLVDPDARAGGPWWSTPVPSRLPVTTRALPGLGAVGLTMVDDGLGWHGKSARCCPLAPAAGARIYEIGDPSQWTDLVTRYPLDVSRSRRHAWRRLTGWAGPWLIPDYAAVAGEWDAVHLSVAGYLTTAGIAIPAGNAARTLLAGWDPDATWWLSDVLSASSASPPELWREDDRAPSGWNQDL